MAYWGCVKLDNKVEAGSWSVVILEKTIKSVYHVALKCALKGPTSGKGPTAPCSGIWSDSGLSVCGYYSECGVKRKISPFSHRDASLLLYITVQRSNMEVISQCRDCGEGKQLTVETVIIGY